MPIAPVLTLVAKYGMAALAGYQVSDVLTNKEGSVVIPVSSPVVPNEMDDIKILLYVMVGVMLFVLMLLIGVKVYSSIRNGAQRDLRRDLEFENRV